QLAASRDRAVSDATPSGGGRWRNGILIHSKKKSAGLARSQANQGRNLQCYRRGREGRACAYQGAIVRSLMLFERGPELLHQSRQGLGAMAELVFLLGRQLGRGAVQARGKENGIVTEPAAAARLGGDLTFPRAVGDNGRGVVRITNKHHDAVIPRLAELRRHTVQFRQQLPQIVVVAGIFARESGGV